MIAFRLKKNGEELATAGIPGRAVLTSIVTWVQRENGETKLNVSLSGLDSNSEVDDGVHLYWADAPLQVGDTVELSVLEATTVDPPRSRSPGMTAAELRENRLRSAKSYLRHYKRQRKRLEKEIAIHERLVTELSRKSAKLKAKRSK